MMKTNVSTTTDVDKIDFEDLIKDYKVTNVNVFVSYLKEIWRVSGSLK
jgi:hypothetical protein